MDNMCNISEMGDLNKTLKNEEEGEIEKNRTSPVFKCFNHTKTNRGNHLDSSDYDIPSYQANQSIKSRRSSRNETSESVLPFSPVFSPVVVSNVQFQPPSIHSVGTVVKNLKKSCQNKARVSNSCVEETGKSEGVFESLGMNDKDISWVSSMATPPPKQVPGSEFNTIEKATFFPEDKFRKIQPRALFSPTVDGDFGCHPILFTSDSEDNGDEEYKSNIRLSDVCATLKQLEFKSLELLDNSIDKIIKEKEFVISPIIRTKTKKLGSLKKKKKGSLVISPKTKDIYEFSVCENSKKFESEKVNSNFLEDDSFQSMSFSGIDELCKTLVSEQSTTSTDFDKTIVTKTLIAENFNNTTGKSDCDKTKINPNIPKKFYSTKAKTDVFTVSSMDNLHSYAKALEEGDKCNPTVSKIDQPLSEKGIVRLDILNKDTKLDSTKRLHSEISEENDSCMEKKIKKEEDDNSGWENVKHYLSESQLNVSDGEIFRTVENLEKTLASQESKDFEKLSGEVLLDGEVISQGSVKSSAKLSGRSNEDCNSQDSKSIPDKPEVFGMKTDENSDEHKLTIPPIFISTASESKISVSEKTINKAKETLRDSDNQTLINSSDRSNNKIEVPKLEGISNPTELSLQEFSTSSDKQLKIKQEEKFEDLASTGFEKPIQVSSESSKTKFDFEENPKDQPEGTHAMKGFLIGTGKKIQVSAKALEKAKALMAECGKDLNFSTVNSEKPSTSGINNKSEDCESSISKLSNLKTSFEGFSTCSGKTIQISAKALEKARNLMADCEENSNTFRGSSTSFGKIIPVSAKALEKAKNLMAKCEENSNSFRGFSTGFGKIIPVSAGALEKAKALMRKCESEFNEATGKPASELLEKIADPVVAGTAGKTGEQSQNSKPCFTTALGSKVNVSSKALKSAKELWSKSAENVAETVGDASTRIVPLRLGFQTAGGSKVTVSEAALAKAKHKMNEKDDTKPDDSGHFGSFTDSLKTSMKNNSEVKPKQEENLSKAEINESDEWEEIIPSWLHVYTTSPSIASERVELSPVVCHEDGKSSKPEREYIVKSPVLGAGDRFHGKTKRRKLRFEESPKNPDRKPCVKRTSNLSLDFSVPFKKVKFEEDDRGPNLDVNNGRVQAREEQEKAVQQKQKVKPVKGSHLSKKCTEKQMRLKDAVGGCVPEVHSEEVLKSLGVCDEVLQINIENAEIIRFKGESFFGSTCAKNINGFPVGDECMLILDNDNKFGIEEIKRAFLASPGVQPNLVPLGWLENHFKWIIWKLVHYERSFPNYFGGNCLTPNQIMLQLKYRYDREIDRNERSALKKILERDDTSIKRLVLCVCGIKKIISGETSGYELKLTDGWYSCPAHSDPAMTRLIENGKIFIGTKLMTQGATLVNCEQGASPLEINGDVYLKISTNSTRRVRWDTKLGFQKNPENFPISLGSILPQGGPISRIDVILVRIYPTLYMEKTSDGHHVTRNRRSEEKAESEYRRLQEERMEAIYREIQSEMKKSASSSRTKSRLSNFEDLGELESNSDPSAFQEILSGEERNCDKFYSSQNERFSRELREKIDKRIEKEKLNRRNVSEFLRAKIVDFRKPDFNNPAVLSVWNPNEDLTRLLTEGKVISLLNVTISNSSRKYKPLQINTTRQTQYRQITRNVKYPPRKLTHLKDVSSKVCPAFEEVDVVGLVAFIQDVSYGSRLSQIVYLTDLEMNFVGIVFWGSCKDYGWENVLRIPFVVACSNLQWKKNTGVQDIPSLYVSENSVFTENPKHVHLKEEIERIKKIMPKDKTEFLTKCEEELTSKLEDAKWRTKANSSGNDSTLKETSKPRGVNGFESKPTASSTPIKPFSPGITSDEAEPSPIQKRIEKLQNYGEPPSLIPLLVRNNVKRKFKKKS